MTSMSGGILGIFAVAMAVASAPASADVYFNPGFAYQKLALNNPIGDASNLNFVRAFVYSAELGLQKRVITLGLRGDWVKDKIEAGAASATLYQVATYATLGLRFGGLISVRPLVGVGYLVNNEIIYTGTASNGTYKNPGLAGFGALELGFFPGPRRRFGFIAEGGYRFVVPSTVTLGGSSVASKTSGVYGRGGLSLRY